jgi:hypothetical protein
MFESLDDQLKQEQERSTTKKERIMKWVLVAVVSLILFAGLYMGVRLLS